MKQRYWFLIVAFATLLLALVWQLTQPQLWPVVVDSHRPPTLSVLKNPVSLGTVNTDSHAKARFYLSNLGGQVLRFGAIEPSCGCTIATVAQKTLKPGETIALWVDLDTSLKLGQVHKTIVVQSNDPARPEVTLVLQGTVVWQLKGHQKMAIKDPLVLFKGRCATCHSLQGQGKTGRPLFQADCAMCHGLKAQGVLGPSLLKSSSADRMRNIIANGAPNNPSMPPFSIEKGGPLNAAEIDSLMQYLEYLRHEPQ